MNFKLGIGVPVSGMKMKLSRKKFVPLENSRMYNKFYALANFNARFLERVYLGTSKLLGCLA